MQMCRSVFDEIVNIMIDKPPEIGGIIGGDKDIVKKHYLDSGVTSDRACSYTPNVSLLNAVIFEWATEGIQFMGIYHTHFFGVQTLSEGDIRYINKILYSMPIEIELLYFPLIVFPSRFVVCYKAIKKSDIVEICEDDLVLI